MPTVEAGKTLNFISEIEKAGEKYESIASASESIQLIKEGRKSEVNARLRALVADNNKTTSDYFILSNMLYRADISTSYSYIKIADELSPENPNILFEYAMHLHRAGNCKAALPMYEKSSALFKEKHIPKTLWGYVTHCRLVLGDYSGAMESWRKVDFHNHHTAIEKSMYEIFSTNDPDSERERLMNSISAGSADGVCELIKLDKNWERDWWNVDENSEYFAHDVAFLKNLAKNNTKIDSAVDLCIDAVALNDTEFRKYIMASGYWGNNYVLPEDPTATYTLISQLQKREVATPTEILERYENQLVQRHLEDSQNQRTLDVLAFLYSATGQSEKLKKIDLHGWKSLKIEKYAQSYIQGIPETAPEYQQMVEQAAKDFPNSVKIQRLNLTLHNQSEAKAKFLMKYVAAEFSNVKNHLLGPYRLNDFMASLEYEIDVFNKSHKAIGSNWH